MNYTFQYCFAFLFLITLSGCSDPDYPDLTGLENTADFTFEIDEDDPFTVHFNNTSTDYHSAYWRFGDDTPFSTEDSPSHTYPYGGSFDVVLSVQGESSGGEIRKVVELESDNPWTITESGYDELGEVEFLENGFNVINSNNEVSTNVVVWQEIEVEARSYQFSADVTGGGMNNAWAEVHLSFVEPDGDDYAENNLWSMNTWADCGIDSFDGNIVNLSCNGSGSEDGIYTFEESGSALMVIKVGSYEGGLGPDGITFSDVSLELVE